MAIRGTFANTELCVQFGDNSVFNNRAYCVSYEYSIKLATVYKTDGSVAAGRILNQINFNAKQRATLANGQFGMAAVLVGPNKTTSINPTSLRIEASALKKSQYGYGEPPT